jgi:hypothetical protein
MLKRTISILLTILYVFFITLTAASFAGDEDYVEATKDSFEIIEPSLGENNEFYGKNLLINIAILEEAPMYLTLSSVDALGNESFSSDGDNKNSEFISLPDLQDEYIYDVEIDRDYEFEEESSYSSKEKRKIMEAYEESFDDLVDAQNQFVYNYNIYNDYFFIEEVGKIEIPDEMTEEEAKALEQYKDSYRNMIEAQDRYDYMSGIYDNIRETVIIDSENILENNTLLYYRTTVENIKPGTYKLILKNYDGDVLEDIEFDVKDKPTEDQILDEKPNPVKDLIKNDK